MGEATTNDDVFPDRDMEFDDKIAWVVETQGWCAVPVAAVEDPPQPGYTYSIGFERSFAHAEVVIFGLPPVAARGLLEMLAIHLEAGGVLPDGMFVGLLDNDLPAALLPIDTEEYGSLFPGATAFYGGSDYRAAQFVWPDKGGKMPWDEDYNHQLRVAQPVIGT